jgi:hypothetical protein
MARAPRRAVDLPPIDRPAPRRRRKETDDEKALRLQRLAAQLAEREVRAQRALASLTGAKPRNRHGSVTPLDQIEDPEQRLEVLQARVERMEGLLSQLNRKRETRAKIVMGGALMAEARDLGDEALLARVRDILDRRVERPLDRLAILEAFGIDLAPDVGPPPLPDFDTLIPDTAKSVTLRGADVDPDYKGLKVSRSATAGPAHRGRGDRPEE